MYVYEITILKLVDTTADNQVVIGSNIEHHDSKRTTYVHLGRDPYETIP